MPKKSARQTDTCTKKMRAKTTEKHTNLLLRPAWHCLKLVKTKGGWNIRPFQFPGDVLEIWCVRWTAHGAVGWRPWMFQIWLKSQNIAKSHTILFHLECFCSHQTRNMLPSESLNQWTSMRTPPGHWQDNEGLYQTSLTCSFHISTLRKCTLAAQQHPRFLLPEMPLILCACYSDADAWTNICLTNHKPTIFKL